MELWKFYCAHQDVTIDQLSTASRTAFLSCHRAYMTLPPSERDIITEFFTTSRQDKTALTRWYAMQHRLTPEYINQTVRKACRLVAVEMGIADQEGGEQNNA